MGFGAVTFEFLAIGSDSIVPYFQTPNFSAASAVPSASAAGMRAHFSRSTCCIIALCLVVVAIYPVSCLDSDELAALQKIYDSDPTLMQAFGWTSNVSEACTNGTTWNQTITCVDDHIARVYALCVNCFLTAVSASGALFLTSRVFSRARVVFEAKFTLIGSKISRPWHCRRNGDDFRS